MIVGHTVKFGRLTRNFHFSFHMPLFFMLSGYTTRLAKDLMECRKHLRKNALHLIGPCLCIGVLSILAQWLKGGNLSLDAFWQITRTTADAYYWASGVSLPKHPAAGAVWFLFSLFWAKTCMDAISLCFQKKNWHYLFVYWHAWSFIGLARKWLPQNADVTMVAVLFVYLGMVWKEHAEIFDRYELGIFYRFLVYGYIVCVLVFISKWQGEATLICLSAYLRLYVVLS